MKERPIIFSASMVRAILDGHKTQTRRKIKRAVDMEFDCADPRYGPYWNPYMTGVPESVQVPCPYGKPGDRLWVRETFCIESSKEVAYEPPHDNGRPIRHHQDEAWGPWWEQPHYRATDPPPELEIGTGEPGVRWRPSIYMPRWASRITLEITDVRVQRLQDISDIDASAEGCSTDEMRSGDSLASVFARLWESINGADSWDANPWVWAITFKRITP